MKLFYQLTDEQKHNAIHYCLFNTVIEDLLNQDLEDLKPNLDEEIDEEEKEIQQKIYEAVLKCKEFGDDLDSKIDYIMSDDTLSDVLHSVAHSMAQTVYYHENEDFVIFMEEITDEEDKEIVNDVATKTDDKKLLN